MILFYIWAISAIILSLHFFRYYKILSTLVKPAYILVFIVYIFPALNTIFALIFLSTRFYRIITNTRKSKEEIEEELQKSVETINNICNTFL